MSRVQTAQKRSTETTQHTTWGLLSLHSIQSFRKPNTQQDKRLSSPNSDKARSDQPTSHSPFASPVPHRLSPALLHGPTCMHAPLGFHHLHTPPSIPPRLSSSLLKSPQVSPSPSSLLKSPQISRELVRLCCISIRLIPIPTRMHAPPPRAKEICQLCIYVRSA